jgi:ATP-binding protein involved in chromosome partitioning
MVAGAIQQFLREVEWGDLDYLLIDLPPGTGDAQLTLAQTIPLTGVVICMTPQDVAMQIASKALGMFRQLKVKVLGIVENMSYFICPHCHESTEIFSSGGGRRASERLGVPLLGEIPLDQELRIGGDVGQPVLIRAPESQTAEIYRKLAVALIERINAETLAAPVIQVR